MDTAGIFSVLMGIAGIIVGAIGIIVARHFGNKQKKAEEIMSTFIGNIANQSQSVANSLKAMLMHDEASIDWLRGKIEGTFSNMAALNGTLQKFYQEYYKKEAPITIEKEEGTVEKKQN